MNDMSNGCPFHNSRSSEFKKISFREYKERASKITREDLENKLSQEKEDREFHKQQHFKNRTIITADDHFYIQYTSIIILDDLWNGFASEYMKNTQEKFNLKLFERIKRHKRYQNLDDKTREGVFIGAGNIIAKQFVKAYSLWIEQYFIEENKVDTTSDVGLAIELRNYMDRLFGNNIIGDESIEYQFFRDQYEMIYPILNIRGLTEETLDKIIFNSVNGLMKDCNMHIVESTAKEVSKSEILEFKGINKNYDRYMYILDDENLSLKENPDLLLLTEDILEMFLKNTHYLHSREFYGCPVLFIKDKETGNNMGQEIFSYKFNFYKNIYLALEANS